MRKSLFLLHDPPQLFRPLGRDTPRQRHELLVLTAPG